jgi:hypothetical protein
LEDEAEAWENGKKGKLREISRRKGEYEVGEKELERHRRRLTARSWD